MITAILSAPDTIIMAEPARLVIMFATMSVFGALAMCGRPGRWIGQGGRNRCRDGDESGGDDGIAHGFSLRSEEHTSELQSLMRISYAVFCLKKTQHKIK